jgi:NAD(P)-dependent dehydrogenase (short-subunit alcohol dehydrogenase family)
MAPRVVVVTGASAGVGRAVAMAFARQGDAVALIARGGDRLREAKEEIEKFGGRALVVAADVASAQQVEVAAEQVERELGPIDVWVNNAMATILCPAADVQPDEYERVTQVTYLGTVHGTLAALRRMKTRGRGVIVQVGSVLAYRGIPLQAPYSAAKHAVRGFTDSLRAELRHEGSRIHVTMVQLPALNTPQLRWCRTRLPRQPKPVGRIFQPEMAAEAVVWAASHRRRELFAGWPTVLAIQAQKFINSILDRWLAKDVYRRMMTDEPLPAHGRRGNLFEAVSGPYGAHGPFDSEAHARSLHLWVNLHQTVVLAAVLGATAVVLVLLLLLGVL